MATLYELAGEYRELLDMIESGDFDEQLLSDTIEGINGEIETKADNYAKIIKELEGNITTIKFEMDRLGNKKTTLDNSIKILKQKLQFAMVDTNKTKFKTELFSFGIQKNPPKLILDGDVPKEFLIEQEPKINNSAIRDLLKAQELDFAHLEVSESLRIR